MNGGAIPDVETHHLCNGDRLLLCSDGLTGMLEDHEIWRILRARAEPEAACKALVDAANYRGGRDNITAVVLDCEPVSDPD
jgi:protein phosphatase